MRTILSVVASSAAESCWLAALVVVPVFFNVHSFRTFEEDKIPLFRSLTLVVAVALVIRGLEEGRRAWNVAGRLVWRQPLVATVLALSAAYGLSTVFSIAPQLSVWGSYERMQGTYTWLSYVVIFFAIALLVRTPQQVERLVTAIILASVAPTLYAIVQRLGLDPLHWGIDVTERPIGTAGNAIFLGAYLVMVVPLTLARTIAQWQPGDRRGGVAGVAYLVLLALQLLTLMYSRSRGPMVGLAVSVAVVFLVMALQQQRRRLTIGVIGCIVGAGLFIGVLNSEGGPLTPLRSVPAIDVLGRIFEAGSGTGRVRVVIWGAAVDLLAAHPWRDLIGYGPETLYLAYTPFYPPELARYESRTVAPDRAHNETFDALITTGVVGCVAELMVFASLFSYLLRHLGLINSAAQRRGFAILVGTAGVAAAGAAYALDGSFRFSGLCLPLGMVVGLVAYLLTTAMKSSLPTADTPPARNLLLLALFGGLLAHFVEIQFGIAVASTRLLFWVYAALVLVAGTTVPSRDTEAESAEVMGRSAGFDCGLMVGVVLLLLTFAFYRPDLDLRGNAAALLTMFLGTWLFGAVLAGAIAAGHTRTELPRYSVVSIGVWLLFSALHIPWLNLRASLEPFQIEQVLPAGRHLANCLLILYVSVFAVAAFDTAVLTWRAQSFSLRPVCRRSWHVAIGLLLLLAIVPVIVLTNLDTSRADIFLKQVDFYTNHKRLDAALLVAEQARTLDPSVDQYAIAAVRVLTDLARAQPGQRTAYLARAQAALEGAERRNPLNLDNIRNLARLHRQWAVLATDPAEQKRHIDSAQGYYREATRLSPSNASLWNEWALLYIELHEPDRALPLLNHSLEIDDGYVTTWWLRADLYLEMGSPERSLADYDRALKISPALLAAWSGKALALARLNRLADAISANQEALKIRPNDLISHRNLAVLYYQTGQTALALEEAKAALKAAQSDTDKAGLEEFITALQGGPGSS